MAIEDEAARAAGDSGEQEAEQQRKAWLRGQMRTFASELLGRLDAGQDLDEIMPLLEKTRAELAPAATGTGEEGTPVLQSATALLVQEDGWIAVEPGTLRFIEMDTDFAMFTPATHGFEAEHAPSEEDFYIVPLANVLAMRVPCRGDEDDDDNDKKAQQPAGDDDD